MNGLTEGRIVHFVLPASEGNLLARDISPASAGQHRAAIVVRVLDQETGMSNLTVFLDGGNDQPSVIEPPRTMGFGSVFYDEYQGPGTWHWPDDGIPAAPAAAAAQEPATPPVEPPPAQEPQP